MKGKKFLIYWVEALLHHVTTPRGRKTAITRIGHLNCGRINQEHLQRATPSMMLVVLTCLAMCCTRKEWNCIWQELGDIIFDHAEELEDNEGL